MSLEYGFVFSADDCIECRGCEVACKNWRGLELGVHWRRVTRIWHGTFPEVTMDTASVSCMHCADPICVKECPESALSKREDGIVVVDREKCIGCENCLDVCPYGAPQFGQEEKMQKCDLCTGIVDLSKDLPPCAATCPTKALTVKQLSAAEKVVLEQKMTTLLAG